MLRISRRRPERFLIWQPGWSLCSQCLLQLAIIASLFVLQDTVLAQVIGNAAPKVTGEPFMYVEEGTEIGSIIGYIQGEDAEGQNLTFRPDTQLTADLVSLSEPRAVENETNAQRVDVILKSPVDRDYEPATRTLTFVVRDDIQGVSFITLLIVIDVNDEKPQFINLPYEITIKESAKPGSVVFSGVTARDPDLGRNSFYSMESNAQGADAESKTFEINRNNGNITLTRSLDYEKHNYYQFLLSAEDEGGLTAEPAAFVVYVQDVQDSPPYFINLPYSTPIDEDTPVGQSIQKVVALDGDRGVPNNLTYSFISGDYENFDLDASTGEITIKTSLDRDSDIMRDKGGVYAMTVQTEEIVPPGQTNTGITTATALVTITVQDVNDNGPLFGQENYRATVLENMQEGVPVVFQGHIMEVSDIDQGTNSHFLLTIERNNTPYYGFAPQPQDIYSESAIVIRVNNSDDLDYENNKRVVFQVIARELDTVEQRSSTATMTVDIEDMNDNVPKFTQAELRLNLSESTPVNTPVATYSAEDVDSGTYGIIQYSIRGGNGRFSMDPSSGVLSVTGSLDREENYQYYLTVEARDGGGLRASVEVTVTVLDANDNKPLFRRDDYEGIITEGASEFLRSVQVEATDEDETDTPNSLVSYRLVETPPGLESNFTVDASTGQVSLLQPLDYEELDPALKGRLTLVVEAYDAGDPVQASQVMVNITVEDDNDFTPVFTSAEYTTSIPENSPEGFVVKTVEAIDKDGTSPNNDFIYRIESGALDKFRIDFETGDVQVEKGADLDRERRSEYTLTLSAIDRGTPPRTGYCTLKITLNDMNDETPEFQPQTRSVTVNENTAVNSPVLLFSANDLDLDPSLAYSLGEVTAFNSDKPETALDVNATGIKDYFGLDATTGQVFIKSELDRETADRVVLAIVVEDTNADVGQQTATGTLSVTIQDYNDNHPSFLPSSQYNVDISEADSVQSIVLQVSATDADFDQTVDFSIGTDSADAFEIRNDGTIRLKSKLNREAEEQVVFYVVAKDNGSPPLSSTATVTVRVLDDNDNTPVFLPYETSFEVSEDVSEGYQVTKFSATDSDAGENARVVYSLAGSDNDDGGFVINSTSGELTVGRELDRERKATYRFEVVASDSPEVAEESKSRRTQSITITILDVDDNAPVFTQLIPVAPFTVESSPVDQTIATVLAVDADDPLTDNGRVIYSLTSDTNATLEDGSPLFTIAPNTGIIATATTLRGYAGYYYITVMATNQARKFTPTRTIEIAVRDVNDDVPRFTKPSSDNAIAYVLENSDIGTTVFDLEAVDNDIGPNGEIRYSIVPLPNSDRDGSGKFEVNATSGLITTTSDDLNAESQDKYELRIIATDQGYPDQYSTSLTMVVVVLDKNDHKPEFDGFTAPHPISMRENTPDECVSVNLAVDKDLNTTFTRICYYLIGSSLMKTFILNVDTGDLCLNKSLDRETTPYVNIVIQALEDCYRSDIVTEEILPLETGELYPPMFRPTYPDKLWIEIKVLDLNDNPPKFKSKDLALGVTRVTQFGRFILDLRGDVTDDDSTRWGVDKFEAVSPFQAYPDALRDELDQLQVTEPFRLFPNGSVKTNMYFKPQMSGYFTVQLQVLDKGGLSDTATLRISLINDDQRLIIVFRRSIDSVGPIKDEVASRLSAKVGYRIVVDTIQTHETETGQADPAKTDMYIHGEDFATNEVIPATRLLSLIDQKNALLVDLLNDYNVVEMTLVNAEDLDDGLEDKLRMALILVAVVLGSVCIILALVLVYVHKRYVQKLKAATAMAYEPNNTNMYISDIPGANIHSYENANPIFMEKIMLDSREDGLNSMEELGVDNAAMKAGNADDDNDDDEEQEVILDISYKEDSMGSLFTPDGATLAARGSLDQHQRYLATIISEHKVKVERSPERKEALVVDLDTDDEYHNDDDNDDDDDDDDDVHKYGKARESNTDGDDGNDYDGDDDNNDKDQENEKDDDDMTGWGVSSRPDSGIEEKAESNTNIFPMMNHIGGALSAKEDTHRHTNSTGHNGLHAKSSSTSSSSSSSKAPKFPKKTERKAVSGKPNSYSDMNGGLKTSISGSSNHNVSPYKAALKTAIESKGGVRVFPPEAGTGRNPPYPNGSARPGDFINGNNVSHHKTLERLSPSHFNGEGHGRIQTEQLPKGAGGGGGSGGGVSPPVRRLRTLKAPTGYSDFKNGLQTRESDLESFVELTDL